MNKGDSKRGNNGNEMEKKPSAHFLRWYGEIEKSSGSHKTLSLFSISLLNQTGEITYFYSLSLSPISLFSKSSLPNRP